ncbi:MAG: hypothetical protein ACT4N9_04875 [Paracoccaceae bacterium]
MSRPVPAITALPAFAPRAGLVAALRLALHQHLARIRAGHEASARLSGIADETLRDTRASAEALTGESAHQEALPFFLQPGFGRRQD